MRILLATLGVTVTLAAFPIASHAQTVLDHRVQRAWDSLFDPDRPGDPRTHWERRHDERRAEQWSEYCHYHPGAPNCYRR